MGSFQPLLFINQHIKIRMANKILVIGDPGTGKTIAAQNLNPKEVFYICCDGKGLPFKGWKNNYKTVKNENGKLNLEKSNYYETNSYDIINSIISAVDKTKPNTKVIIIDTITACMEEEFMSRIKEKGFGKFDDSALHTYKLLNIKGTDYRDDLTFIILAHTEDNYDSDGILKTSFKVIGGKIMKDKITAESKFNYVLSTEVIMENDVPKYYFLTQNTGKKTSRSPLGVFEELRIPNDYKEVLETIKKFEE
jgi:DNA polymerase III delta prime subunit